MKSNQSNIPSHIKPISETELFRKYKSSYSSAFIDLSVHTLLLCSSFYSAWYFKDFWFAFPIMLLHTTLKLKTFTILHDCCHDSYIPNSSLSVIISVITSVVTSRFWLGYKTRHLIHHKTNGAINNEYNFHFNETVFFTLKQYAKLNAFMRQIYKISKHQYIALFFGFFKVIILEHFSFIRCRKYYNGNYIYLLSHQFFFSTMCILMNYMFYEMGLLTHYLICTNLILFYALMIVHSEHTYNPPYVVINSEWTYRDSGILGSSFIEVPYWLKYIMGGLEYHHIHHMNSKIPGYNLQAYHEDVISRSNMFDNVVKLSITDCYNNLWLVLYDEDKKRYITFAEADEEIRKEKEKEKEKEKYV